MTSQSRFYFSLTQKVDAVFASTLSNSTAFFFFFLQAHPFIYTNKNSMGQFRNFQQMPEHKPAEDAPSHASALGVVVGVIALVAVAAVVVVIIKRKYRRQSYGPISS